MTTINTFQDILDAMEQNPVLRDAIRRHILTEELLQLPAQVLEIRTDVGALKTSVSNLETDVGALKTSVATLETDVSALKTSVATLETDVGALKTDVGALKISVTTLEIDVGALKTDVGALKTSVTTLETDVAQLKDGQARLETDFSEMKVEMARIGGHVSRLAGADYESAAAVKAQRAVRSSMGITGARLLTHANPRNNTELNDLMAEATQVGRITDEQADDLGEADIVLTGNDQSGNSVYVVAEVSITVQEDDVARAGRRAEVLQKASGRETIPATIGADITEEAARAATERIVAFIRFNLVGSQPQPAG